MCYLGRAAAKSVRRACGSSRERAGNSSVRGTVLPSAARRHPRGIRGTWQSSSTQQLVGPCLRERRDAVAANSRTSWTGPGRASAGAGTGTGTGTDGPAGRGPPVHGKPARPVPAHGTGGPAEDRGPADRRTGGRRRAERDGPVRDGWAFRGPGSPPTRNSAPHPPCRRACDRSGPWAGTDSPVVPWALDHFLCAVSPSTVA
jgi:hypothetical protein